MRVLVVTNLFPNALEPNRGLFNLQPLEELRREQGVSIRVVAPVPWSPGAAPGKWRRYAALPAGLKEPGVQGAGIGGIHGLLRVNLHPEPDIG